MTVPALGSPERPLRVAVIGSGPAGFYTAEALLKAKNFRAEVDVFDRLPTPFGLVRFGVAPDHQKIKSVIKGYAKIASLPGFRFLGNVRVCMGDVTLDQLLEHYDQVVFAVGCETDRRLSIPGEDASGSHAATSFVAWYNGHPDFRDYEVSLDVDRAAIIGIGDVAMDLARMMVQTVDELAKTDIADYALDVFEKSRVREVFIVARRGPAQAAFATKELDDIAALPGVDVRIDPDVVAAAEREPNVDGLTRRKLEFLSALARRPEKHAEKRVTLRFCAAPIEITEKDGKVTGLTIEHTELVTGSDGWVQARGTGRFETLPVGLVFRSVGYRGVPLEGLPFDDRKGIIPNADGRVLRGGSVLPRVYVSGWIKRGPSGVIGTNKADAAGTVAKMIEDAATLETAGDDAKRSGAIDGLLAASGVRAVTFADWLKLDAIELGEGARVGKVRHKLTRIEEMLAALDQSTPDETL